MADKKDAGRIIKKLKSMRNPANIAGMARFGINPQKTLGVPVPELRSIARQSGHNQKLAEELWESGIHEARILASMIAEKDKTSERLADKWVEDFDSWDVCDQTCYNLFRYTDWAYAKAMEWCRRKEEFVRRAGFALAAGLSVSDKKAGDEKFTVFFPLIKKHSVDERNFVKKAVNWVLRQIGKRNLRLNMLSVKVAEEIRKIDSASAHWIAGDAIRELTSPEIRKRLKQ